LTTGTGIVLGLGGESISAIAFQLMLFVTSGELSYFAASLLRAYVRPDCPVAETPEVEADHSAERKNPC